MNLLDMKALTQKQRKECEIQIPPANSSSCGYSGLNSAFTYLLFQDWFGNPYVSRGEWEYHLRLEEHLLTISCGFHSEQNQFEQDADFSLDSLYPIDVDDSIDTADEILRLIMNVIAQFGQTTKFKLTREGIVLRPISVLDRIMSYLKFPIGDTLFQQVVGVTGCYPYGENLIKSFSFWQGAVLGDGDIWGDKEIIVVGRRDFDKEYLNQSIVLGQQLGIHLHYFSQEDFIDFVNSGREPNYFKGDPRINEHEGLSYLASIGFEWPVIPLPPVPLPIPGLKGQLNLDVHPLLKVYGYSAGKDVTIEARKRSLEAGIQGLGLKEVVIHIAGLIRLNKQRKDDRMENAIANWIQDLKWLHDTKYRNTVHSFVWPNPDLDNW